ncbi:Clavaminate synthase-like protein [Dentipellis sp. KUC8613]|nr:Clavaminate synthase-like protein [Dentipellis sp. KUC8613]
MMMALRPTLRPRALPLRAHNVTSRLRPRARLSSSSSSSSSSTLTATPTTDALSVALPNGTHTSFSYRWLRDSCQCPACVHPSTRQKLHRTSDVPAGVAPLPGSVKASADGIHLAWATEGKDTTEHTSFFPASFLAAHASPASLSAFHRDVRRAPWDAASVARSRDLYVPYAALGTDAGLLAAISQLERAGLLFVTGVPTGETGDATCELRRLVSRFGPLRNTFYGEVWDVKNVVNSTNIAYTNLYLGLHMDILYFENPPRFQILHCLRNRVQGGTSLFVDALRAAGALRTANPAAFDILTSTPVPFHYINAGHHLHRAHPTIALAPAPAPETGLRPIAHVNYSPPFQAPLPRGTPDAFYDALGAFAALLEAPGATFEYTLKEGDAVLFDNRSVLHARTAFSDPEVLVDEKGEQRTNRWLKGCYFEGDDLADRGRVLREKLGVQV